MLRMEEEGRMGRQKMGIWVACKIGRNVGAGWKARQPELARARRNAGEVRNFRERIVKEVK